MYFTLNKTTCTTSSPLRQICNYHENISVEVIRSQLRIAFYTFQVFMPRHNPHILNAIALLKEPANILSATIRP